MNWLIKLADYEDFRATIERHALQNPYPFKEWFDESGKIFIPLEEEIQGIDENVANVLEEEGCVVTDYRSGYCQLGNRTFRINKLIQRAKHRAIQEIKRKHEAGEIYNVERAVQEISKFYDDTMAEFESSVYRVSKSQGNFLIVISQDPHDVASMSTDRNWESCMTLGTGSNQDKIFCEVATGGLVAYLIYPNDLEIQNPLARIHIRHFKSRAGQSIAIPEKSVYGNEVRGFEAKVKEWIDSHGMPEAGMYGLQGGSYSDTFGDTMLIAPSDPEGIMKWYRGEGADAQYSTWTVTDTLHDDMAAWDDSDQEEITFDTHEEAQQYLENRDYDDSWREYYESLDDDFWTKFDEKKGEYVNQRFEIKENPIDQRKEMKRKALHSILTAPRGTYPMEFIQEIKEGLDFKKTYGVERLFAENYPELMDTEEHFRAGPDHYYKYIAGLPENTPEEKQEKESLKREELEVVGSYLDNPMQMFYDDQQSAEQLELLRNKTPKGELRLTDTLSMHFTGLFNDKILHPLKALFKPVPELILQKLANFGKNIEQLNMTNDNSVLNRKKDYNADIIGSIVHIMSMTESDTPTVQNFYQYAITKYWGSNINAYQAEKYRIGNQYSPINVDNTGWAIARLGSNGRQFIPFIQEQLEKEQGYLKEHKQQEAEEDERNLRWDDPLTHVLKITEKNIEKYLYILDALQSGTGRSTKYRFSSRQNWLQKLAQSKPMPLAFDIPRVPDDQRGRGVGAIDSGMSQETADAVRARYPGISYLGEGNIGVAGQVDDKKLGPLAIKHTRDFNEKESAEGIMENPLSCVIKIFKVEQIQADPVPIWEILSERVEPLNEDQSEFINIVWGQVQVKDRVPTWEELIVNYQYYTFMNKDSATEYQALLSRYSIMVSCLEGNGLLAGDTHADNIGFNSEGTLVLLDLGYTNPGDGNWTAIS